MVVTIDLFDALGAVLLSIVAIALIAIVVCAWLAQAVEKKVAEKQKKYWGDDE